MMFRSTLTGNRNGTTVMTSSLYFKGLPYVSAMSFPPFLDRQLQLHIHYHYHVTTMFCTIIIHYLFFIHSSFCFCFLVVLFVFNLFFSLSYKKLFSAPSPSASPFSSASSNSLAMHVRALCPARPQRLQRGIFLPVWRQTPTPVLGIKRERFLIRLFLGRPFFLFLNSGARIVLSVNDLLFERTDQDCL